VRTLLAFVAVTSASCALVVDLDGLRTSTDGGMSDATPDASPEAGRFCDGIDADVCEDMDNDAALLTWYQPDAGASIDDDASMSAPRSLVVSDFDSASLCVDLSVSRPFLASSIDHATLEADVFMAAPQSKSANFLTLRFTDPSDGTKGCLIMIGGSLTADSIYVQSYASSTFGTVAGDAVSILPPSPLGRWRHVLVDVDFAKDYVTWNVDHGPTSSFKPLSLASTVCRGKGLASVDVGLHCVDNPAFSYRYDNVVITSH
jgi:hypothetical protein